MLTEAFRLEIALQDASRYETAYNALRAEAESLLSRNSLAEDEAAALSAINAELIGHTNPLQKIHHIARIRQELDECKQQLVQAQADFKSVANERDNLSSELRKYCSLDASMQMRLSASFTKVRRLATSTSLPTRELVADPQRPHKATRVSLAQSARPGPAGASQLEQTRVAARRMHALYGTTSKDEEMTICELEQ